MHIQNENKHNKIKIREITKLPNFEQSYKGKVKPHKYTNRQISQQPENCENRNDPNLGQAFLKRNGGLKKRQTSRFHYGSKVPAVTIPVFITKLEQNS